MQKLKQLNKQNFFKFLTSIILQVTTQNKNDILSGKGHLGDDQPPLSLADAIIGTALPRQRTRRRMDFANLDLTVSLCLCPPRSLAAPLRRRCLSCPRLCDCRRCPCRSHGERRNRRCRRQRKAFHLQNGCLIPYPAILLLSICFAMLSALPCFVLQILAPAEHQYHRRTSSKYSSQINNCRNWLRPHWSHHSNF